MQIAHSPLASLVSAYLIPTEHVGNIWPLVEKYLSAAAERSGEDISQWRNLLDDGRMQLWIGLHGDLDCDAAVLTEIIERKPGRTCQIVACGGNRIDRWFHLLDEIENWAESEGCVTMRVQNGRRGWKAMLTEYAETGVTLEKRIA